MKPYFLILFIILFLSGCREEPVITEVSKIENIELLVYANQGMMSNYETVINRFNDTHENIQVMIHNIYGEDWTDYERTFRSYLLSGKTPDIVDVSVIYRNSMIEEGLLMDLMPLAEKAGLNFDLYFENQFDGLRVDESLYGIPSGAMLMGVFINKDLFREAGLVIPSHDWQNTWTLEEFAYAANKIRNLSTPENQIYGMTMSYTIGWILPFLMGNGSKFLSENSDVCTADEPQVRETFEFVNNLMFKEQTSPSLMELISLQPYQYFMNGNLGMTVDGNWWMEAFRDSADFDWGVVPMPMSRETATGMYVDCWAIPSASTKAEAAFEVLLYFLEEEQQKSGIMKGIPLKKSSAIDIYMDRFPRMTEDEIQVWFKGISYGHVPAYFRGWTEFQNESTEIMNQLGLGNLTVDEAINQICGSYKNNHRELQD